MENTVKRRISTLNIPIGDLHHHPKNPRKDIGDIEELTESIKKNGIMQNLTVIPGFYRMNGAFFKTDAEFTVIIGHRRLEAARAAGLEEVPCRIYENLPESEQITTMLEENMQRNDLTPIEQADSFQLCLDLGETVDSISEKTGFAKSTIYHRLNLGKLDREVIEEIEEDDSFQITMKDYIELEKIKDIETRNKVLAQSRNSNDLRFRVDQEVKGQKVAEMETEAKEILEKRGLTQGENADTWSGKYDTIYRHDIRENGCTNRFKIPEDIDKEIKENAIFVISWGAVIILNPRCKEAAGEEDEPDEGPSEWEIQRQEREERSAKYKAIRDPLAIKTHDFVMEIITGKLDDIDKTEILDCSDTMLNLIMSYDSGTNYLEWDAMIEFMTGISEYDFETHEEFDEEVKRAERLPLHHKLLIGMVCTMEAWKPINYDGTYDMDCGKLLLQGYDILERWGWTYTDEERLLLNGNHELYVEEEEQDP